MSRKVGETICIGGDIRLTVVGVDSARGQVRLAVDAPKDVLILRGELLPVPPSPAVKGAANDTHAP